MSEWHSRTYPEVDDQLDNMVINFTGIDWEYFDVKGLIAEMKDNIPKEFRDYDEETRSWVIDPAFKQYMNVLLREYFGNSDSQGEYKP